MQKILNSDPAHILVDPVTEKALLDKAEQQRKKAQKDIENKHKENIKAWFKDNNRVNIYKTNNYQLINDSLICIEICSSYIKNENTTKIISDSLYGLSVSEEESIRLFPYAKDLSNGDIYTISDSFTFKMFNPAYAEWYNRCLEKPSYREEIPAPNMMLFPIDEQWNSHRFFLDKIKQVETINDYYTFVISKSVLQTKFRVSEKNNNLLQNENISTTLT